MAQTSATVSSTARQAGQRGRVQPDGGAGQLVGAHGGHHPGGPQRGAPVHPEAAERARGGERLGLAHREPHPPGQVGQVAVGPAPLALDVDLLGQLEPDTPHLGQPQPDRLTALAARIGLQHRFGPAEVDVGAADEHPVPAGVGHQRLRGVEAHRLGVEQRRTERGGVVPLEPGAVVDQRREADGVALGEAEVREGQHPGEDRLRQLAGDAVGRHAARRTARAASPSSPPTAWSPWRGAARRRRRRRTRPRRPRPA